MEFLSNNFITEFFILCLHGLHTLISNYAVTIIILTVLLRLCVLPLDIKQRGNQSRMQALAPEIASLKKRYASNPQKLQKKQNELYRKMNVKPMMGCLQSLIQLPIWFAFFGAMRVLASEQIVGMMLDAAQHGAETVVLPQFFWVHNLWQPDTGMAGILPSATEFLSYVQSNSNIITPQMLSLLQSNDVLSFAGSEMTVNSDVYEALKKGIIEANGVAYVNGQSEFNNGWFILPALAGVFLFLQQKFAPAATSAMGAEGMMGATQGTDPQAQPGGKFMKWFMPIFSVIICLQQNSAFALYWCVSSLYAFSQMRVIDLIRKVRNKDKGTDVTVKNVS